MLVHWNPINNVNLHDSRILYTFTPQRPFWSLIDISPSISVFLETFQSEFYQNSELLELEDRVNFTLVINLCVLIRSDIQLNPETEFMPRAMNSYRLQKIWIKICAENIDKSFLTA